jgi:hypothetical protein
MLLDSVGATVLLGNFDKLGYQAKMSLWHMLEAAPESPLIAGISQEGVSLRHSGNSDLVVSLRLPDARDNVVVMADFVERSRAHYVGKDINDALLEMVETA